MLAAMSEDDRSRLDRIRGRREPPPLREVTVVEVDERSPRLVRVTFEGAGLRELEVDEPAASVRLLVPSPDTDELVIPQWNGNEFLLPGGARPALRTFTPLRHDRDRGRLDLEIVRHGDGAVSGWVERAGPGSPAAISGPGRGYEIDGDAERFVLLGDESALPAMSQLLETLPGGVDVEVHVEVVTADAQVAVPDHPNASISWHVSAPDAAPGDALVAVARELDGVEPSTRVWAAGEAASMQAIRRHLFDQVGMARAQATVRGYWKRARS